MKKNILCSLCFCKKVYYIDSYIIYNPKYQNNIPILWFLSALSTTCEPDELVKILNDLFARFDKLASVSPTIYYLTTILH